ncbi:hypothetical protein CBR_g41300 [Chara braunii]|uniref:beta-carotene 3-hydroxylase n=1 Tax=Chara braunii TaxID=69332 RepID=A0A388LVF4_CHABU|nr:hypothetical protein CBR_g41300 [Chara braunii]|eukprot:GBG86306.1 hypothetical protein CBR_g41300 [Chara braunii]
MAAVVAVETATAFGCAGYGVLDRTSVAGVLATRGAISSSSSSPSIASIGHIPSFPPAEGGMGTSRMTTARTGLAAAAMAVAPARRRTTSLRCLMRGRVRGPSLPHGAEDAPVVIGLGSGLGSISQSRGWRREERGEGARPTQQAHAAVSSLCPGKGDVAGGCSCCCGYAGDCLRRPIGSFCAMAVGGVSDRGRRRRRLGVRGFFVRAAADVELELADRDGGNAMTMADGEDIPPSSSSPSSSPSSSSSPSDLVSSMAAEDELGLSSRAVELGARVAAAVEMQSQIPVTMAKKGKEDDDEEDLLNDNSSSWLQERRRRRTSQQTTYQFAAIASTIGFAMVAAGAVWYRFIFQLEGNPIPLNEVLGTFALAVGAAGLGITLFGIAYMFVHDGLVHKRFPVGPIADLPYLKRVAAAHQLHHADKFEGVPFGLFLGPQELAEVGGVADMEELLKARQGR